MRRGPKPDAKTGNVAHETPAENDAKALINGATAQMSHVTLLGFTLPFNVANK